MNLLKGGGTVRWSQRFTIAINKDYGSGLLPVAHLELEKYNKEELFVLYKVRREKGCYSAWALCDQTHQETPWLTGINGAMISIDTIKDYFCEVLPQSDFNYDLLRMVEAVEASAKLVPEESLTDFEAFERWINQEL